MPLYADNLGKRHHPSPGSPEVASEGKKAHPPTVPLGDTAASEPPRQHHDLPQAQQSRRWGRWAIVWTISNERRYSERVDRQTIYRVDAQHLVIPSKTGP